MKKQFGIILLSLTLIASLLPLSVFAQNGTAEELIFPGKTETVSSEAKNGLYLPDVTAEMSNASYWAKKVNYPDAILADQATIQKLNEAILNDVDAGMNDLKSWPETFNGKSQNESNVASATENAQYAFNNWARYDREGNYYSTWDAAKEHIYDPMIENAVDPNVTEEMHVLYGICTTRTCLQILPTDHPLWDDYSDPDFGYLWQSTVRVNEPVILKTKSKDGLYYLAITSNSSGWIPAKDVAVCADKAEWLAAWDLAPEKTLVVYGDKVLTEESYYAPETANRLLTMGTCLELADESVYAANPLIINRRAYNNHVVYLPVRNEDGSYRKVLSLIGENRKVSEGFLPLTQANVLSVMMNQLGDTYGWGGMLLSADCSGFVRDVYKCFGLEIARNTTWQTLMPVYTLKLTGMSAEQKAECIRDLPPGTSFYIKGHTMMYLGEENDKLYVISSVSDVVLAPETSAIRVRGGLINTLDIRRGKSYGYETWLEQLTAAVVPYYPEGYPYAAALAENNVSLETTLYLYTGKEIRPHATVTYKNRTLVQGTDYTVSYSDNVEVGTGTVTVTGTGKYSGTITEEFTITKNGDPAGTKNVYINNVYGPKNMTVNVYGKEKPASKAANPITVKAKKKVLTAYAGKNTKIKAKNAFVVSGAKGTVSYKKLSGNKKITVAKNGTITVKKGLKKGHVYKVKVRVIASGNDSYKKGYQDVVLKIKIK